VAYTNVQAMISFQTGSHPRQPPSQTEAPPISVGPHTVRWRQSTTMVGAVTLGALVAVIIPSRHKQWGRASFRIRGEKERCCSDSLKIEMVG
jgi:hypothetical protein